MQRYGWLWSGDVDSSWKTLQDQIAVGLNAGLTGLPYGIRTRVALFRPRNLPPNYLFAGSSSVHFARYFARMGARGTSPAVGVEYR